MNLTDLKERIAISSEFSPDECDFLLAAVNEMSSIDTTDMHTPPNYMGRIEAIWMVLSVDEGGEGVVAAPMGQLTMPLLAADKRRLDQIIPLARKLATTFNQVLRLAKFTVREDIEVYPP